MNDKISEAFISITDTMHSIMTTLEQTISGGLLGLVTELKILVEKDEPGGNGEDTKGFIYYCISFLELYISHIKKIQGKGALNKVSSDTEVVKRAYYYIMVMFGQLTGRTITHLITKIAGSGQNLFEFGAITDIAEQILLLTPYGKVYSSFVEFKEKIENAFQDSNRDLGGEVKQAIGFYNQLNTDSNNNDNSKENFITKYNLFLDTSNTGVPEINYDNLIEVKPIKIGVRQGGAAIQSRLEKAREAAKSVMPSFQRLTDEEISAFKGNEEIVTLFLVELGSKIENLNDIMIYKAAKAGEIPVAVAVAVGSKAGEIPVANEIQVAMMVENKVKDRMGGAAKIDILHNKRINDRQGNKSNYKNSIKISNNHEQLKKKYEALLKKLSHLNSIHNLFKYLTDKTEKTEDIKIYLKEQEGGSKNGGNGGEQYLKRKIIALDKKIIEDLNKKIENGDDSEFIEILDKKIRQIKKDLQTKINEQIDKTKPITKNAHLISGLRKLITFIKFTDFEKYSNLKSEAGRVITAANNDVKDSYKEIMETRKETNQQKQKEKFLSVYRKIIKKEKNLNLFLDTIQTQLESLRTELTLKVKSLLPKLSSYVGQELVKTIDKLLPKITDDIISQVNTLTKQQITKPESSQLTPYKMKELIKNLTTLDEQLKRLIKINELLNELERIAKIQYYEGNMFVASNKRKELKKLLDPNDDNGYDLKNLDPIDMESIYEALKNKKEFKDYFTSKLSFSSKSGGESKKTIKNIKDKVNKITRRLQTSYSNFNKGHNTRRVSFVKPKKNTRKKSY